MQAPDEYSKNRHPDLFATPERLHRALLRFNQRRLRPSVPSESWRAEVAHDAQMQLVEGAFLEEERRRIIAAAAAAPRDADPFVAWFEGLRQHGPGQGDPLFPWLEEHASLEQMRWFLLQEFAGEAGFDDLVALTQLKLPVQPKLELARNYWDEMGRGRAEAMHGPMLDGLAEAFELDPSPENTVWEAHALANVLCGLAFNRRYAYHAIGALGAVELTAPDRSLCVDAGLKRLGFKMPVRRYYAVHSTLDVKHSIAWNREVLRPLVADHPECATALAEGALMRLYAGARCFIRYRRELGLEAEQPCDGMNELPVETPLV